MDASALQHFEALCERFYTTTDAAARQAADEQLRNLRSDSRFCPQLLHVFQHSRSHYALFVSCNSLTELVSSHWGDFTHAQTLEIRNGMLQYLSGPLLTMDVPQFVTAGLIQLVCRVTKLGWFSAPERGHEMRSLATDVDRLLQNTPAHCVIGLSILEQLLLEMNRPVKGMTLTTHRKCAVSFRDHSMLHIFNCTLNVLKAIHGGQMNALPPPKLAQITELGLKVLVNSLSFDFIGTNPDESAYEVGTIQIPKAWEAHFMPDQGTMPMLFELYMSDRIEPPQGMLVLESLVLYASARRSIFRDDAARGAFLHQLMAGIAQILAAGSRGWKDDENCYHQLCRLLGKLKANYQLSELVRTEGYAKWVDLCFHFTKDSFERLDRNANSSHYLLALWAKMVSATPYVKSSSVLSVLGGGVGDASKVGGFAHSKTVHGLDQYVPRIIGSFVEGRLNAIHMAAMSEAVDTPLENPDVRQAQLQHMPHISRYYYADVARQITRFLDLSSITQLFTGPPAAPSPVKDVHEQQAGWLVYVVASLLDGQLAAMNLKKGTNDELTDAELCRRVLVLAHGADERMRQHGAAGKCHRLLEMSFLEFFRAFHRAYIGEHRGMPAVDPPASAGGSKAGSIIGIVVPPHASPAVAVRTSGPTEKQKMYQRMFAKLGLGSHEVVIEMIVRKLGHNLRHWAEDPEIIKETLGIFTELVAGYSSGRLMLKLDTVKFIMGHHTEEHFPFLVNPANERHRSTFYKALAKLLFLHNSPAHFDEFMSHFLVKLQQLGDPSVVPDAVLRGADGRARAALIGVCRDLRGMAQATHNSRTYTLLFDSLYPAAFPAMQRAASLFADDPGVSIALLRFMEEFVHNTSSRIYFDHCSPNGILLFRKTSEIAAAFAQQSIQIHQQRAAEGRSSEDPYKAQYKCIGLCLTMLSRALSGHYVNFGVFALYGDKALDHALGAALQLSFSVSLEEMMKYPKVSKAFFQFLEVLFRNHMLQLVRLDASLFFRLVDALVHGMNSLDVIVANYCAAAMDSLATFHFRQMRKDTEISRALRALMQARPEIFAELLNQLFSIVFMTVCSNHWALGKPILSLMLASEESFVKCKHMLMETQPPEKRPRLDAAFTELVSGIRPNLEQTNRDRFNQHLASFRKDVVTFLVT